VVDSCWLQQTQKTTTMPTDTALKELVGKHDFLSITEKGKVHCDVTDHDISGPTGPPTIAQVLAHMEQKKFKRFFNFIPNSFIKFNVSAISRTVSSTQ
jgi:hypothetical protein